MNRRRWKREYVSLFVIIFMSLTMLMPANISAQATMSEEFINKTERIYGEDRYDTAYQIALKLNTGVVDNVVLATGTLFADALAGVPLAYQKNAPILLVNKSPDTSSQAFSFLKNHVSKQGNVYILGEQGAIPITFETRLIEMGFNKDNIYRLGGRDRYETSVIIAKALRHNGTQFYMVSGDNFPDALSASVIAATGGVPLLLVPSQGNIPDSVLAFIKPYQTKDTEPLITIIGGLDVVPAKHIDYLREHLQYLNPDSISRISGADRYETMKKVNEQFLNLQSTQENNESSIPVPKVYIASGENFPDALTGAVLAASVKAPLILVNSNFTQGSRDILQEFHNQNLKGISKGTLITVFGGSEVFTGQTIKQIEEIFNVPVNYTPPVSGGGGGSGSSPIANSEIPSDSQSSATSTDNGDLTAKISVTVKNAYGTAISNLTAMDFTVILRGQGYVVGNTPTLTDFKNNGNGTYEVTFAPGFAVDEVVDISAKEVIIEKDRRIIISQPAVPEVPSGLTASMPSIAFDSVNTRYLLVYENKTENGYPDIYGKFVDLSGVALGNEFLISDDANDNRADSNPKVTFNHQMNKFIVTWSSRFENDNIYGRLINATTQQVAGSTFQINSTANLAISELDVCANNTGFFVVWDADNGTMGRLIDENGTLGNEITIPVGIHPAVAYGNGHYLVAAQDDGGIKAQLITENGILTGQPLIIATRPSQSLGNRNAEVAFGSDDKFFVVWEEEQGSANYYINGRIVGGDGTTGNKLVIAGNPSDHNNPDIAFGINNDQFLVTWEDNRNGNWDIYGQRIALTDGSLVEANFSISMESGDQKNPAVAFDKLNQYLVTYINNDNPVISIKTVDSPTPNADPGINVWTAVGNPGFTQGMTENTKIAIAPDGTPYIAFVDYSALNRISVMKYSGSVSGWEYVGTKGFATSNQIYISLFVDENGIPYVAFQDSVLSSKVTVMKYSGSGWETVGQPGLSESQADFISLFVKNGIVYLAYKDYSSSQGATVMKFDGTSWNVIGSPNFSNGEINFTSLYVDSNGIPYLAYRKDLFDGYVDQFDGTNWIHLGNMPFSEDQEFANEPSLFVDEGQDNVKIPYVAYSVGGSGKSGKIKLMQFTGVAWITVGSDVSGFTPNAATNASLVVLNGVPYVAFRDQNFPAKVSVMKYESSWETIGESQFSEGGANFVTLAAHDYLLYVIYSDQSIGGKATVMKCRIAP